VRLLELDLRPRQILTRPAFLNAAAVVMATAGSTNAVLHLLAIAAEVDVELSLDDFDRISRQVPQIVSTRPSGKWIMSDLHRVDGVPRVLRELLDAGLIDGNPEMAMQDMDVFKSMQLKRPMELFMFPKVAYRGTGKVYWAPGGGESQGVTYDSELMLAMNRNSKVQEEAWSFLSFLLSEQMQSQPSMDGYPIRKSSLKTMLNQFVEMLSKGQIRMAGPSGDTPPAPTEAEIDAVVALAEQVGAFAGSDPQIMNMVKEEAASFFGGAASAEDAAELIQNRVGTYLNE